MSIRIVPRSAFSYPAVGSTWKERDLRTSRTIKVVRYDTSKKLVRIVCLETDRLTWAKVDRFNGKSGGYEPFKAAALAPSRSRKSRTLSGISRRPGSRA